MAENERETRERRSVDQMLLKTYTPGYFANNRNNTNNSTNNINYNINYNININYIPDLQLHRFSALSHAGFFKFGIPHTSW